MSLSRSEGVRPITEYTSGREVFNGDPFVSHGAVERRGGRAAEDSVIVLDEVVRCMRFDSKVRLRAGRDG